MVKNTRAPQSPGGIRPLGLPQPIQVKADERGWPQAVKLGGRWVPVTVDDRWRVDDEWWREESLSRSYFRITLQDDSGHTVFQDLTSEGWFAQR